MIITSVLCSSAAAILNSVSRRRWCEASKMVGVEGVLVVWCVWAWVEAAGSQRPPSYHCHMYKESHPHSSPYTAIRAHCVYPCGCGAMPECRPGVPLVQDGCGCCWQCARQEGEPCDGATLCDSSRNLTCVYSTTQDLTGTCQEVRPAKCSVNNRTYDNGESFTPDCRTQCTCQNGTYACVSLCPSENLLPSAQCHNPHLVTVPGQCCREWMCDTDPGKVVGPPTCERVSGRWSQCSQQSCGAGVSVRWSTDNTRCQLINQTRLCQLRPCQDPRQPLSQPTSNHLSRKHHIRRWHTCKATQRYVKPVRLRAGWCVSERRYRPKFCGACTDRCCSVYTSTTISMAFLCPLHANTDLLAAPHAGHPLLPPRPRLHAQPPTTHATSVYDMMDEGQPVLESVLTYSKRQHHTQQYSYNSLYDDNPPADDDHQHNQDYLDDEPLYKHENLTVDDDLEYDDIKTDNYEVVHYQVEWIMRCKCSSSSCDSQDPARHTSPLPSPMQQATTTPT